MGCVSLGSPLKIKWASFAARTRNWKIPFRNGWNWYWSESGVFSSIGIFNSVANLHKEFNMDYGWGSRRTQISDTKMSKHNVEKSPDNDKLNNKSTIELPANVKPHEIGIISTFWTLINCRWYCMLMQRFASNGEACFAPSLFMLHVCTCCHTMFVSSTRE